MKAFDLQKKQPPFGKRVIVYQNDKDLLFTTIARLIKTETTATGITGYWQEDNVDYYPGENDSTLNTDFSHWSLLPELKDLIK